MITSRGISISAPLLGGVSRPLKKPPGEGTGPTRHADLGGNLVGRVPPRGEPDVFQQAVRAYSIQQFSGLTIQRFGSLAWATVVTGPAAVSLPTVLLLLATQVLTCHRADAAAGPANDSFTNRALMTGTNTTVTGSNAGAG